MADAPFSSHSRAASLKRFRTEKFDLLVIGGGITGTAVARDAVGRGLKVALVEKYDFAWGTSSRSSKLIHGGLRYLENMEFGLVFEALSERALLLKSAPHMVRPLRFFWPVYKRDNHGRGILNLGLWFYDLLSLFRSPEFHRSLSTKKMLQEIPFLNPVDLKGGFRYADASMWDDVLAVETARAAAVQGAAIATYTEAISPIWEGERIAGFRVLDREKFSGEGEIQIHAANTVVCAGPWTDEIGIKLSPDWQTWLKPSKGVHLIFDLKRIPIPGAMVMTEHDGRIAFVIPRPDFGSGVVIVGTTDGPTPKEPEKASVEKGDVDYLMSLLNRYFPSLGLKTSDILSAYVGVRPLMGDRSKEHTHGSQAAQEALQKVSREHYIGHGPGRSVLVAGGKYTTHRKMAEEIVDFMLKSWHEDAAKKTAPAMPEKIGPSTTKKYPVNPKATDLAVAEARAHASKLGLSVPEELYSRYGAGALEILQIEQSVTGSAPQVTDTTEDPQSFPFLAAQLRHAMRNELVMHLEDFYIRRMPLYASRADHGLPWAEALAKVWAEERGFPEAQRAGEAHAELESLRAEITRRTAWFKQI